MCGRLFLRLRLVRFGDVGDGVDVADLGGEEGVAGVLDHLSGLRGCKYGGWELSAVKPLVEQL